MIRGPLKRRQRLMSMLWLLLVFTMFAAGFAAAYVSTAYLVKIINFQPAPILMQVMNSFLGLIIVVLLLLGGTSLFRSRIKSQQMGAFGPIIRAMEQISRGDFNVQIDNAYGERENQLFGELVNSVNHMAGELSQMEKLRQEFISNVSHEIQSPLTSIRGFAQALENDRLSADERKHYLGIITDESTRLSRITENLLRLASLEADQIAFEPRAYRLDKQIRSLILACEPQWTAKGLDLDISLEEVTVTGDEDLLSQVWINLIHNSIKFTPQGGKVCIALQPKGDKIVFKISDSGIGIPEPDLPRVFERFYKADPSRTSAAGGSGLGLSIAKKIVEMHHGTIGVESTPGSGTVFTVSLPSLI